MRQALRLMAMAIEAPGAKNRQLVQRTLQLQAYSVQMHLGILPHEKAHKQHVLLDIKAELNICTHKALAADEQNGTVDHLFNYQILVDVIESCTQKPFHLQEALIDALAQDIFAQDVHGHIQKLSIKTQKVDAYAKAQAVAVIGVYG